MPRAPKSSQDASVEGYLQSLEELHERLDDGLSWSGNERNCVYLNPGSSAEQFANVSAITGLDFVDDARGLAFFDWDGDGDLDLALANRTAPRLRLMRNRARTSADTIAPARRDAGSSLAFWLQGNGTTTNRDAVGARIEVPTSQGLIVRGVRAGEGFLSQSSRWIHVGLGDAELSGPVVVRWPQADSASSAEPFGGIVRGNRYRLVQNSGRAERARPRPKLALAASVQQPAAVTTGERLLLAQRLPAPSLTRRPFARSGNRGLEAVAIPVGLGRPVLINFWASWCLPCRKELAEIAAHSEALQASGLEVVALSTDGLGDDPPTAPEDGLALMDSLEFPFVSGMATSETLDKVDLIQRALFDRRFPLALPFSMLLDPGGSVAAIYRGPVEPQSLLDDLDLLEASPAEISALSAVFPGRSFVTRTDQSLARYARWFEEQFPDEAVALLARSAAEARARIERSESNAELSRAVARHELGEALRGLAQVESARGDWPAALRYTRELRALEPDDPWVRALWFNQLLAAGDLEELQQELLERRAREPGDATLRVRLSEVYDRRGDPAAATRELESAVDLEPTDPRLRFLLGQLLAKQNRVSEAIRQFERTVELDPDHEQAHTFLAFGAARQGDADRAIAHFSRVLELDPDPASPQHASARQGLARIYAAIGQPELAIPHYQALLSPPSPRDPPSAQDQDPSVHQGLAIALLQLGRVPEAVQHLRRAYELDAAFLQVANDIAWTLATHPEVARRSGDQALVLAQDINERTGHRELPYLETLAAALAEIGRFDEAVVVAERTRALALERDLSQEAALLESRLELYRERKALRIPDR